ncbi:hypothetical protein ILYODFUR_012977, partial [Ilyodon furcidens]
MILISACGEKSDSVSFAEMGSMAQELQPPSVRCRSCVGLQRGVWCNALSLHLFEGSIKNYQRAEKTSQDEAATTIKQHVQNGASWLGQSSLDNATASALGGPKTTTTVSVS